MGRFWGVSHQRVGQARLQGPQEGLLLVFGQFDNEVDEGRRQVAVMFMGLSEGHAASSLNCAFGRRVASRFVELGILLLK
jgi:hypothetical protein